MPTTSEPPAAARPPESSRLPEPVRDTEPVRDAQPLGVEPLGTEPLGVELAPTGHPGVDAGLARLEALDGVPAEAHVAVYEDVHQRLVDTLAALDQE
ncbi:hypothetical protein ACGF13_33910 [Kitasatospora sp. NPDC048286]|uniref:hypothetical protein n=1 Tax=Kitasatospora sp. NPDC048286 TaxID=3364047 RepID=UPI00371D8C7F